MGIDAVFSNVGDVCCHVAAGSDEQSDAGGPSMGKLVAKTKQSYMARLEDLLRAGQHRIKISENNFGVPVAWLLGWCLPARELHKVQTRAKELGQSANEALIGFCVTQDTSDEFCWAGQAAQRVLFGKLHVYLHCSGDDRTPSIDEQLCSHAQFPSQGKLELRIKNNREGVPIAYLLGWSLPVRDIHGVQRRAREQGKDESRCLVGWRLTDAVEDQLCWAGTAPQRALYHGIALYLKCSDDDDDEAPLRITSTRLNDDRSSS
ncbi:unnamed protein product [Parajaminaea phylloscopi]